MLTLWQTQLVLSETLWDCPLKGKCCSTEPVSLKDSQIGLSIPPFWVGWLKLCGNLDTCTSNTSVRFWEALRALTSSQPGELISCWRQNACTPLGLHWAPGHTHRSRSGSLIATLTGATCEDVTVKVILTLLSALVELLRLHVEILFSGITAISEGL